MTAKASSQKIISRDPTWRTNGGSDLGSFSRLSTTRRRSTPRPAATNQTQTMESHRRLAGRRRSNGLRLIPTQSRRHQPTRSHAARTRISRSGGEAVHFWLKNHRLKLYGFSVGGERPVVSPSCCSAALLGTRLRAALLAISPLRWFLRNINLPILHSEIGRAHV